MKTAFAWAAVLAIGASHADEPAPPFLKDGLWQHTGTQTVATRTTQINSKACENHATQVKSREMAAALRKRSQCTVKMSHPSSDVYVSEMHCAAGTTPDTTTKGVETYHADSFRIEQHRLVGSQDSLVMSIEGKYLGACPADMKPGDTVLADGTKMNLFQQ
jgi:hypothetical protein